MARLLDKKIILLFIFIISFVSAKAQQDEEIYRPKDYKDREQFEKFRKRRMIISAWQINQLKEGALVVKLKTNINQINAFSKHGEPDKAIEKTVETYIINKNIMMAYIDNFKFCKIYFIYSNSNDSLLKGLRSGFFLDTNLKVDPTIVMNEKFYLIAEKDFNYNSSIGFVKEDSARFVSEKGNPSGGEFDIVVKNKYGHQLKRPFPYLGLFGKKVISYVGAIPMYYKYEENAITYTIDKKQMFDRDQTPNKNFKKPLPGYKTMMLHKGEVFETISYGVERFDENLNTFYKESPKPDLNKIDPVILPFLY
jgi:hypothetical protein